MSVLEKLSNFVLTSDSKKRDNLSRDNEVIESVVNDGKIKKFSYIVELLNEGEIV